MGEERKKHLQSKKKNTKINENGTTKNIYRVYCVIANKILAAIQLIKAVTC